MTSAAVSPATQVSTVTLLARDQGGLSAFYQRLLGLTPIPEIPEGAASTSSPAGRVTLGAHGRPLLHLEAAPHLPAPQGWRPGLYHTAFLLPTRADLGRWLAHAAGLGVPVGSGDHLVSEAFYLTDPEGNGIEVYADRPRATWQWQGGQVKMDTLAVDIPGVLLSAGIDPQRLAQAPAYAGAPAGTTLGHVHLKVGQAQQAAQFYAAALGLDVVASLPGAAFVSWGGYHHHIGLNEWHSRGQGRPTAPAAGLGGVDFCTDPESLAALRRRLLARPDLYDVQDGGDHLTLPDPWGNRLTLRAARG